MVKLTSAQLQSVISRYNLAGPRYTSYPTAPVWTPLITAQTYRNKLQALNHERQQPPISLYVHIPFCAEICHFCGCTTFKVGDRKIVNEYINHLIKEWQLLDQLMPETRNCVQIHWGGGTPTYLNEDEMARIYRALVSRLELSKDAEVAIELDPRVTNESQLRLLRALGFNRVSFGVQDNDPEVQKASNRVQPEAVTEQLYQLCRQLKFHSINFDLIYGLPKQSPESFERTVRQVIAWQPDRIALFSYAHVPWLKPFQRKIQSADLPAAETKLSIFLAARDAFIGAGYIPIGMDHFAKPNDELAIARKQKQLRRNFQGYTVKPESNVYALGISGISDLGDLFVQNSKKFNHYFDTIDRGELAIERGYQLSANDQLRRTIITQLMCNFSIDIPELERRFDIHFNDYFQSEMARLDELAKDGLVQIGDNVIEATPLGEILIRNISMVFDDYLPKQSAWAAPLFSKTI